MKIYSIDDKELLDVKVTSAAVHEEEMMKSNLVRLSWKSNVKINLAVGTYIIPYEDGLKYRLIEPYEPTQDSEDTFTYQPEFQHPIMWLSKVPFTYATKNTLGDDVVQQEWEYTGLTLNILKYAVDFINTTFGFTDKEKFVLTPLGNIDTNVSLSFSSTDVLSALSAIANCCTENKCEYHLSWEHKALYFGQVSINLEETIPTLKVGENVGKASVTQTKGGYYNVFYPQGSTRNMSVKAASGENVSTGIRLGLNKTKYPNGEIDTRDNANEPKQTLAMTFDEVYPHVDCYVYNVRKRTRYLLDDENKKVVSEYNADGSVKSYKTYTVWYMRLAYPLTKQISGKTPIATTNEKLNGVTQTLYWYDYEVDDKQIIDGYTLCGSFSVNTNEGALGSTLVAQPSNGDGFELKYHKIDETIPANATSCDSGVAILKGDYEIVFVNQNDTIIPTNEKEGLIPRGDKTPSVKGNIVILYNIAMGDDEVTAAQDELERKTLAEIAYRHSDLNNYAFTAYPNVFAKNNPHLYIGQRVKYDDGNGYSYTTRVLKLTTNLDYDICQEITVGNSTIKGAQTQLKEDVQGLISGTISVGSGLSYEQVVNICKNYTSSRYLSKTHDDETKYKLKMGGAVVNGVAEIKDRAKSDNFDNHAGFPFGTGWAAIKDDGSESHASMLEVDKLFVRMKAYFAELEIRKISYLGGNYVFSSAGGKIYYVEWLDANGKILEQTEANKSLVYTFRCYLYSDDGTTQTMNWFQVDDQVRCQNFGDLSKDAKAANGVITDTDHTTHYWWRRVNAVGNGVIAAKGDNKAYQYIDFQNTVGQYGTDSDFPEIGDAMVQFGNWTTASRQGVIMIVVTGDDAPAIIEWQDVGANGKHFTMPENEYTRLSPRGDGNIIRGKFISVSGTTTDHTGQSLDDQISALVDQLNDIKNQADKKFDIWFNGGEPHPNSSSDTENNQPASDWTTDAEKALHAQDLYYDTDKSPASKGGRAWRWMAHNSDSAVSYYWDEVTDKDTIGALEKAADLQNQVDDIVSDGVISRGSEKSSLLVEWNTACSNYNKYNEQVTDYSLRDDDMWKAFSNAFFAVATMLNNGADYTYPNVPTWINSDSITKDTILADTPCHDAVEYRAKWNAYYESLAALLAAITKKAKELADNAQTTADSKVQTFVQESTNLPNPPFKAGDFWIQTDKDNNVMVCTKGNNSGNSQYVVGDYWADLSDIYGNTPDVRTILATLADKVWTLVGESYLEQHSNSYIDVYIGSQPTSSVYDSDISYYNGVLYERKNGSWTEIKNSGYENTFVTVMAMLGTIKIRVFNYSTPPSPNLYDLALTQISIQDPVDGQVTKGNYEIMMYNEKGVWEVLRSCTLAIMKSYGDHIVNLVKVSEQTLDGRIDNLSGTYVTQTSFNAFSQCIKFDKDGNITNIQKSGLLTTADGNLLYALSQGNSVNMLMGTTTGVGWTKETSSDASYFSFNEADREFRIVNYYPAFSSGYSGSSFSTLKSPIVRVERGKRYIISFQAIQGTGVNFNIGVRFGTASLCDQGQQLFEFNNRVSGNYEDANKKPNTIYQSKSDNSRYYIIIEADSRYDYMQVLFINIISTYETSKSSSDSALTYVSGSWPYGAKQDTQIGSDSVTISHNDTMKTTVQNFARYAGSTTQYATFTRTTVEQVTPRSTWVSKLQLEKAVRTELADIEPSSYKESQNAIESYIKQTADSIELRASKIIFKGETVINGKFIVDEDGNVTLNYLTANNATINGVINAESGKIGGWQIDGASLKSNGQGAAINIEQDGYNFARFGNIGEKAFLYVRMDKDTSEQGHWYCAAAFNTYGSNGTALSLLANGKGYALESYGRANLCSRNAESVMINHLALKTDSNTDSFDKGGAKIVFGKGGVSIENESFSPNVIITSKSYTNISLPANPNRGDLRIVVQGSSDKVTITDPNGHWFQHGNETARSSVNSDTNGQWTFFLYDGFYWQVVYCNGRPW